MQNKLYKARVVGGTSSGQETGNRGQGSGVRKDRRQGKTASREGANVKKGRPETGVRGQRSEVRRERAEVRDQKIRRWERE